MHKNQHKGWSTKYLNLVHHAIEFSNNLRTQQTHHTIGGSHVATDYECKATVKIKQIPGKQPAALAHTNCFYSFKMISQTLMTSSVPRACNSRCCVALTWINVHTPHNKHKPAGHRPFLRGAELR